MRDAGGELKAVRAISPQATSGTTEIAGAAIDRLGFNSMVVSAVSGASTGTPTSFTATFRVAHCDTSGGTYVDVSGATVVLTAVNSEGEINVDLSGLNRYVKVLEVPAFTGGTSPTLQVAATVTLGQARTQPA